MHHDSTPVTIDLGNGNVVIVDAGDVDRVLSRRWYRSRAKGRPDYLISQSGSRSNRVTTYLHRFIIGAEKGEIVDHVNGDTFDVRRANLRFATHQQNMMNARVGSARSRYKGVQLRCDGKRWIARIQFNKRSIHLGSFDTAQDAAKAYDMKARELFGEFARLNFPD